MPTGAGTQLDQAEMKSLDSAPATGLIDGLCRNQRCKEHEKERGGGNQNCKRYIRIVWGGARARYRPQEQGCGRASSLTTRGGWGKTGVCHVNIHLLLLGGWEGVRWVQVFGRQKPGF